MLTQNQRRVCAVASALCGAALGVALGVVLGRAVILHTASRRVAEYAKDLNSYSFRYATEVSGVFDSLRMLDIYAQQLAAALAQVINIVDPYAVVLGGGISNIDSLYTLVPKYWSAFVFTDQVQTQLLRNRHGDSSGVRGAAWLWT